MILIDIIGTECVIRSQDPLTVGTVGSVVEFHFDKAWDTLTKTVVFRASGVTKDVVGIESAAVIPPDVLQVPGVPLHIGVYGKNTEDKIVIPTVWAKTDRISSGADPEGDESTDPALPVWAQMEERLVKAEETLAKADAATEAAMQAAGEADAATEKAMQAAGEADAAAEAAQTAAGNADTAASKAVRATADANTAADNARTAAGKANSVRKDFLAKSEEALRTVYDTAIVCDASGQVIGVADAAERPLQGLILYGKTTQNGTPTPYAPVALESVGDSGSVGVSVCGKNLLENTATTTTTSGVTFTVNADGSVTANGTATGYVMHTVGEVTLPAGTYILTGAEAVGKHESSSSYIRIVLITNGSGIGDTFGEERIITITEPTTVLARIDITSGTTINGTFYPMVRNASITDATYEPYKPAQTLTAQTPNGLPGLPLGTTIPDAVKASDAHMSGVWWDERAQQYYISDTKDSARGVYVKRITELVLNGTEKISLESNANGYRIVIPQSGLVGFSNGSTLTGSLCTHYSETTPNQTWLGTDEGFAINLDGKSINIWTKEINSMTDASAWTAFAAEQYANGTPITFRCPLATPIEIPFSASVEILSGNGVGVIVPNNTTCEIEAVVKGINGDVVENADLAYSIADTSIATVDASGKVTAVTQDGGITTLTVTDRTSKLSGSIPVYVPYKYRTFDTIADDISYLDYKVPDGFMGGMGSTYTRGEGEFARSGKSHGMIAVTDTTLRSGEYATYVGKDEDGNHKYLSGYTVAFWVYDTMAENSNLRAYFPCAGGLGFAKNQSKYGYFKGKNIGHLVTETNTVLRTKGWHEFRFVFGERDANGLGDCELYIDGILVQTLTDVTIPCSYTGSDTSSKLNIGRSTTDTTSAANVYIDDIVIAPSKKAEIDANELAADKVSWSDSAGGTTLNEYTTFKSGQLTAGSTPDADGVAGVKSIVSYEGKTYSNTLFNFKYKVNDYADSWGGFYLAADPTKDAWSTASVLVGFKENALEIQKWHGPSSGYQFLLQTENVNLEEGEEYDITFGMYAVSDTEVRIILNIGSTEIYNEIIEADVLATTGEFYFVTCAYSGFNHTIGKHDSTLYTNKPYTTVYNDGGAGMKLSYVADTKTYIDNKFNELAAALVNNT